MTDGGNRLTVSRITAEEASAQLVAELLDMYRAVQEAVAGTDNDPLWVIGTHPAASQLKSAAESEALFVARVDDRIAGALIADRTPAPGYEDVACSPCTRISAAGILRAPSSPLWKTPCATRACEPFASIRSSTTSAPSAPTRR